MQRESDFDSSRGEAFLEEGDRFDAPHSGDALRAFRLAIRKSQEAVADQLGCSVSTVSLTEAGKRRMSYEMLWKVFTRLGLPPWVMVFLDYYRQRRAEGTRPLLFDELEREIHSRIIEIVDAYSEMDLLSDARSRRRGRRRGPETGYLDGRLSADRVPGRSTAEGPQGGIRGLADGIAAPPPPSGWDALPAGLACVQELTVALKEVLDELALDWDIVRADTRRIDTATAAPSDAREPWLDDSGTHFDDFFWIVRTTAAEFLRRGKNVEAKAVDWRWLCGLMRRTRAVVEEWHRCAIGVRDGLPSREVVTSSAAHSSGRTRDDRRKELSGIAAWERLRVCTLQTYRKTVDVLDELTGLTSNRQTEAGSSTEAGGVGATDASPGEIGRS